MEPEGDRVPGGVVMTIQIDVICISPNDYGGRSEGIKKRFNGEVK